MKTNRKIQGIKITLLSSLYLILYLIYIAYRKSPATNYELSLYHAFPLYFWIILILTLFLILVCIFLSIHLETYEFAWMGIFSLFLLYGMMLFMPVIRGYVLHGRGGSDLLVHIGHTRTILETGQFYVENYYPIVHIILAYLNKIGISLETSTTVVWTMFSLLFIIFIYIWGQKISDNKKKGFFIMCFSFPLLFLGFHTAILPAIFSLMYLPLFFYFLNFKSQNSKVILLMLIIGLFLIFFHPMTSIFLIFALVFLLLYKKVPLKKYLSKSVKSTKMKINRALIILILSYITWVFTFERGVERIERIIMWPFQEEARETVVEAQVGLLERANLSFSETSFLFINRYGPTALYLLIPLTIIFILLIKNRKRLLDPTFSDHTVLYLGGIIFLGYSLVGYLIEFNPVRNARFAILFSIMIMGLFFYKFQKNKCKKTKIMVIFVVFLIVLTTCMISIFNIYGSPRDYNANSQLTHSEYRGANWYLNTRNDSIVLYEAGFDLRNYEIYYYGRHAYWNNSGEWDGDPIPSHFGYKENETLKESLGERSYMITNEFNRASHLRFPEKVHEKAHLYLEEDFDRLEQDQTVNKIYENGGHEVWLINEN